MANTSEITCQILDSSLADMLIEQNHPSLRVSAQIEPSQVPIKPIAELFDAKFNWILRGPVLTHCNGENSIAFMGSCNYGQGIFQNFGPYSRGNALPFFCAIAQWTTVQLSRRWNKVRVSGNDMIQFFRKPESLPLED
jgi:hypothetical protein